MLQDVRLISSQRSYEFSLDQIRLSALSTQPVIQAVQSVLNFQLAQVAPPMPTFGPVAATIPPGVVFDYGFNLDSRQHLIPIRFFHIEPQRIVVDVAGPSEAIGIIYKQVRSAVGQFQVADGYPILGEPESVRDRSEYIAKFSFTPETLLPRPFRQAAAEVARGRGKENATAAATLMAQFLPEQAQYPGISLPNLDAFVFELRAGMTAESRVYYSAAPLPSDEHLAMLEKIESELGTTEEKRHLD